jgi:polygalacturonase
MTRIQRILIPAAFLCAVAAATDPAQYNVREFGALGDGRRKDTAALQAAIDACAKAGGGLVYVQAGRYLTGSIQLRSHITFEVGRGAVLLGSEDPADYPLRDNAWGGARKTISPLLYAADAEDITITGRGTIDGQGQVWWKRQWLAAPKKACRRLPLRRISRRSRSLPMAARN